MEETSYLNNRVDNARRGVADWLDPQAPTLARLLQQHGYATGHFGKWHASGGQRDVDDAPPISAYGFDESLTNFEDGPEAVAATLKPATHNPVASGPMRNDSGSRSPGCSGHRSPAGLSMPPSPVYRPGSTSRKTFLHQLCPDDVHGPLWPPVEKWAEGKRGLYLSVLQDGSPAG